jgi:hypothetical protein
MSRYPTIWLAPETKRRVRTGSLLMDYDTLRCSAAPNGYPCYLLAAIARLKLGPHKKMSGVELNGEPWAGDTFSATIFFDDMGSRETLEFYSVPGKQGTSTKVYCL